MYKILQLKLIFLHADVQATNQTNGICIDCTTLVLKENGLKTST